MKYVMMTVLMFSASVACAGYTYKIEDGDNFGDMSLNENESVLMTGGQGHYLSLFDYSTARIEGTAPLISEGIGGIWLIRQGGNTSLEVFGGEIHELAVASNGRSVLSGGRIDQIYSQQDVELLPPVEKGGAWVPDPHITFVCKEWEHDINTNILTGTWFDDSTFDIQLIDVAGYDPAIENIQFIPEPATMLLLGLGAVAIRKRRV